MTIEDREKKNDDEKDGGLRLDGRVTIGTQTTRQVQKSKCRDFLRLPRGHFLNGCLMKVTLMRIKRACIWFGL